MSKEVWIFAYGSLIWNPGEKSYVEGFTRKFWQKSTDHRGTYEYTGRTVTLLKSKDNKCVGISYLIDQEKENLKELISELDFREKCGYTREKITILDTENNIITKEGIIYIGKEYNIEFCPNENIVYTAYVISKAIGPTGKKNSEYLFNLSNFHSIKIIDKSLKDLNISDEYLLNLEKYVHQFLNSDIVFGEGLKSLYDGMQIKNHFMGLLKVKIFYFTRDIILAKIPIGKHFSQPFGIVHGGVSAAIAEGLGSMGSAIYAMERKKGVVGIQVTSNHISKVFVTDKANLIAEAKPIDISNDIQVWEIIIKHEITLKTVSVSKLTCLLLNNSKL